MQQLIINMNGPGYHQLLAEYNNELQPSGSVQIHLHDDTGGLEEGSITSEDDDGGTHVTDQTRGEGSAQGCEDRPAVEQASLLYRFQQLREFQQQQQELLIQQQQKQLLQLQSEQQKIHNLIARTKQNQGLAGKGGGGLASGTQTDLQYVNHIGANAPAPRTPTQINNSHLLVLSSLRSAIPPSSNSGPQHQTRIINYHPACTAVGSGSNTSSMDPAMLGRPVPKIADIHNSKCFHEDEASEARIKEDEEDEEDESASQFLDSVSNSADDNVEDEDGVYPIPTSSGESSDINQPGTTAPHPAVSPHISPRPSGHTHPHGHVQQDAHTNSESTSHPPISSMDQNASNARCRVVGEQKISNPYMSDSSNSNQAISLPQKCTSVATVSAEKQTARPCVATTGNSNSRGLKTVHFAEDADGSDKGNIWGDGLYNRNLKEDWRMRKHVTDEALAAADYEVDQNDMKDQRRERTNSSERVSVDSVAGANHNSRYNAGDTNSVLQFDDIPVVGTLSGSRKTFEELIEDELKKEEAARGVEGQKDVVGGSVVVTKCPFLRKGQGVARFEGGKLRGQVEQIRQESEPCIAPQRKVRSTMGMSVLSGQTRLNECMRSKHDGRLQNASSSTVSDEKVTGIKKIYNHNSSKKIKAVVPPPSKLQLKWSAPNTSAVTKSIPTLQSSSVKSIATTMTATMSTSVPAATTTTSSATSGKSVASTDGVRKKETARTGQGMVQEGNKQLCNERTNEDHEIKPGVVNTGVAALNLIERPKLGDSSFLNNINTLVVQEQVEHEELAEFEFLERYAEDNSSFVSNISAVNKILTQNKRKGIGTVCSQLKNSISQSDNLNISSSDAYQSANDIKLRCRNGSHLTKNSSDIETKEEDVNEEEGDETLQISETDDKDDDNDYVEQSWNFKKAEGAIDCGDNFDICSETKLNGVDRGWVVSLNGINRSRYSETLPVLKIQRKILSSENQRRIVNLTKNDVHSHPVHKACSGGSDNEKEDEEDDDDEEDVEEETETDISSGMSMEEDAIDRVVEGTGSFSPSKTYRNSSSPCIKNQLNDLQDSSRPRVHHNLKNCIPPSDNSLNRNSAQDTMVNDRNVLQNCMVEADTELREMKNRNSAWKEMYSFSVIGGETSVDLRGIKHRSEESKESSSGGLSGGGDEDEDGWNFGDEEKWDEANFWKQSGSQMMCRDESGRVGGVAAVTGSNVEGSRGINNGSAISHDKKDIPTVLRNSVLNHPSTSYSSCGMVTPHILSIQSGENVAPPPTCCLVEKLFPKLKDIKATSKSKSIMMTAQADKLEAVNQVEVGGGDAIQSKILREKLLALEMEIETFRRENAMLSKLRQKREQELDTLKKEMTLFETQKNEELNRLQMFTKEETKKLKKERRSFEEYQRAMRAAPDRKQREEMEALRGEVARVKEEAHMREARWGANTARLRDRIEALEVENSELKKQVHLLEQRRLEAWQDTSNASSRTPAIVVKQEQPTSIKSKGSATQSSSTFIDSASENVGGDVGGDVQTKKTSFSIQTTQAATSKLMLQNNVTTLSSCKTNINQSGTVGTSSNSQQAGNKDHTSLANVQLSSSISPRSNDLRPLPIEQKSNDTALPSTLTNGKVSSIPRKTVVTQGPLTGLDKDSRGLEKEVIHSDGKVERAYSDGSVEVLFSNGTRKQVSADGQTVTVSFFNGDIKQMLPDQRVVYFYSDAQISHTTLPDGTEVIQFPNDQVEKHYPDGMREISFPDQTIKYLYPTGEEETVFTDGTVIRTEVNGVKVMQFANGQRETHTDQYKRREYPDGTVKTVYTDGRQETRYYTGRLRVKDKDGHVIIDQQL